MRTGCIGRGLKETRRIHDSRWQGIPVRARRTGKGWARLRRGAAAPRAQGRAHAGSAPSGCGG